MSFIQSTLQSLNIFSFFSHAQHVENGETTFVTNSLANYFDAASM